MDQAAPIRPADYPVASRAGLPDALRVLLAEYPRDLWARDPGFDGLIRFWLERHLMFRKLLGALEQAAQDGMDRKAEARRLAATLSRYGGLLVNELHGHHMIEDHHYFPVLQARDARVAAGFRILDADHHALDGHLAAFTEAANGAIGALSRGGDSVDPSARFHAALGGLSGLLDRHLVDEEELVVPVLLKYGTEGFG